MNAVPKTTGDVPSADCEISETGSVDRRDDGLCKSDVNLERAVLTLRALRLRYRAGRKAHPEARSYGVHVVLDYGDMAWITAAIEALERCGARGAGKVAGPVATPLTEIDQALQIGIGNP